jgi:hypothetical protein
MSFLQPFMGLSYEPRNSFRGGHTTQQSDFQESGSRPSPIRQQHPPILGEHEFRIRLWYSSHRVVFGARRAMPLQIMFSRECRGLACRTLNTTKRLSKLRLFSMTVTALLTQPVLPSAHRPPAVHSQTKFWEFLDRHRRRRFCRASPDKAADRPTHWDQTVHP